MPPPQQPPEELFKVTDWSQPRGCYSILIDAPAAVMTVDEGKIRAGLSWAAGDPRDALMGDFIKAAARKVEEDTGLALLEQTRDVYLVVPEVGWVPLPSQCSPTISVTDVTPIYTEALSVRQQVGGRFVAYAPPGYEGVLRVVAGWRNSGDLRDNAPLLYQAVGMMVAHYATIARDLAITGAVASVNIIPEGYEAAISPHRLIWVT